MNNVLHQNFLIYFSVVPPLITRKVALMICSFDSHFLDIGGSLQFSSVQSLSRVQLCDPMNHSTPRLPIHHQLPEFTQTHVHWVDDAIQPSHPLSSPSPAPNPSQHQGLFQWVNSRQSVTTVNKWNNCHRERRKSLQMHLFFPIKEHF